MFSSQQALTSSSSPHVSNIIVSLSLSFLGFPFMNFEEEASVDLCVGLSRVSQRDK